jgi:hypothetical protein
MAGREKIEKKRRDWAGWGNGPSGLEGKECPFLFQTILPIVNYFEFDSNLNFEWFYSQYKSHSTQSIQKKIQTAWNATSEYI